MERHLWVWSASFFSCFFVEEYAMASSLFLMFLVEEYSMSHCLGSALPQADVLEPLAHARPAAFRAFFGGQAFFAFLGCVEGFLESLEYRLDYLVEELGRTGS